VTHIIVKCKEPQTIAEELILPDMVNFMTCESAGFSALPLMKS